jgi:hypothetical protein
MGPLTVSDAELSSEAVTMICQQQVVEIMESYGYDPDDKSGADMTSWYNSIFANKLGLMANPFSDLHNLFKGFDSQWHNEARNQVPTVYSGKSSNKSVTGLGTEVNYYFQGILFRIFGFSTYTGLEWIRTWKFGSGHGTVTPAIEFFFRKGWGELPGLWPVALREQRLWKARGMAMDRKREVKYKK